MARNPSWPRRLLFAALGGLAGLFIVNLASALALAAALKTMFLFFGESTLSGWEALIYFGLAPVLIISGAAITAWALGASLWRGLLAGVAALAAFAFLELGQANYSPFNVRETLAFVGAALATVLVSTVGRGEQRAWMLAVGLLLALALVLGGLRLALSGKESGIAISILAWIVLPAIAVVPTTLRQKGQAE